TLGLARLAQSAPVSIALDTPTEQRTPLPFDLASKARSRRVMGRYRLLARIGEGGYGTVCEAEHVELKKRVALKVVTALRGHRTEIAERFTRDSRRVSRLEDDHVVQIVDAGEDPSFGPFLVMELLHGDDLENVLAQRGRLDVRFACGIIYQACLGVESAHRRGI